MTKQDIIDKAFQSRNGGQLRGGYVSTDGAWCLTRSPEELANLLRNLGFTVTKAYATVTCTAIVETVENVRAAWNGWVEPVEQRTAIPPAVPGLYDVSLIEFSR